MRTPRVALGTAFGPVLGVVCGVLCGMVVAGAGSVTGPVTRTIRVPGTTVDFTLVRCPAPDGGADLWVLQTEVPWELYDVFVYALDEGEGGDADAVTRPSKPYVPPDRGFGHEGFPAISMTRGATIQFCMWLSAATGVEFRLPTREEWSFLASGGTGAPYCCGLTAETLDTAAWTARNSGHTPHRTGYRQPNEFGLFDVHGNVAEWVEAEDRPPTAMGGSYRDAPEDCTSSSAQTQDNSWNASDPQIPKSVWWLADCNWVGFRFVTDELPAKEDDDGE